MSEEDDSDPQQPPAPPALAAVVAAAAGGLLLLSPGRQEQPGGQNVEEEDDAAGAGPAPMMPLIAAARMDLNADGMDVNVDVDVNMNMDVNAGVNADDGGSDDDDMGMPPLGGAAAGFPGGIAVPLDMTSTSSGPGQIFPGIGGSFESLSFRGGGGPGPAGGGSRSSKKKRSSPPSIRKARCAVPNCPKQSQGAGHNRMCRAHYQQWRRDEGDESGGSSLTSMATGIGSSAEKAKARKKTPVTAGRRSRSRSPKGGRSDGSSGPSPRNRCAVPGCPKQSQGNRCNLMCMAHFKQLYGDDDDDGRDGNNSRASGGSFPKARCSVPGCPKQSQGTRCQGMCQRCFKDGGGKLPHPPSAEVDNDLSVSSLGSRSRSSSPRKRSGAAAGNGGIARNRCRVDGCPKQSQGGRCGFMCAAHYN